MSPTRFATAGLDLARLRMRCLCNAARQALEAPGSAAALTHSVKGIKNIMSRDSTKMDASTEFVAVEADMAPCQPKHGPGVHAERGALRLHKPRRLPHCDAASAGHGRSRGLTNADAPRREREKVAECETA